MNSHIIFCVLFASLAVGGLGYHWTPSEEECLEELKLDRSTIQALNNAMVRTSPEDDAGLNKFLECSWIKDGTLDENGELNWNRMKELLAETLNAKSGDNDSQSVTEAKAAKVNVIKEALAECEEKNLRTPVKVQNCMGVLIRQKWANYLGKSNE